MESDKEASVILRNKILHQIDSVYKLETTLQFKRVLDSECANTINPIIREYIPKESVLEVIILNTHSFKDLFYFDKKGKLLHVGHELPEIY